MVNRKDKIAFIFHTNWLSEDYAEPTLLLLSSCFQHDFKTTWTPSLLKWILLNPESACFQYNFLIYNLFEGWKQKTIKRLVCCVLRDEMLINLISLFLSRNKPFSKLKQAFFHFATRRFPIKKPPFSTSKNGGFLIQTQRFDICDSTDGNIYFSFSALMVRSCLKVYRQFYRTMVGTINVGMNLGTT